MPNKDSESSSRKIPTHETRAINNNVVSETFVKGHTRPTPQKPVSDVKKTEKK